MAALRDAYRRDLQHLHDQILIMGSMVDKAIDRSIQALQLQDFAAAREIIAEDRVVNRQRFQVEEQAIRLIATQQPLASDLRSIIAVPLVTKGKVIGAVYVDNPFRASIFEEKDKEFLQAIADLAAIAIDNARQYERSEFLRQLFEAHVNKQVTDYVLTRSGRTLRFLPGERREVTMLNSDIAGFSTLSQSMDAEELVRFLNDYFQRMIRVVLDHGGNIDKFQGDGMLVVFGAPNPMSDHAERALNAALAMVREIERFNRELEGSGRSAISVGMGLDSGEVVAGHVGSDDRMEFTLIGVPVNNSAYLSKVRPARVLMSESTRERVPDGFRVAGHERLLLKGAKDPQAIFELEVPPD